MALPILVFRARPLGVEYAERTTKIPQGPTDMQVAQYAEGLAESGKNHLGRGMLVATHLSEMNRNALRA